MFAARKGPFHFIITCILISNLVGSGPQKSGIGLTLRFVGVSDAFPREEASLGMALHREVTAFYVSFPCHLSRQNVSVLFPVEMVSLSCDP